MTAMETKSFWEEAAHPRGPDGRFAPKDSGGGGGAGGPSTAEMMARFKVKNPKAEAAARKAVAEAKRKEKAAIAEAKRAEAKDKAAKEKAAKDAAREVDRAYKAAIDAARKEVGEKDDLDREEGSEAERRAKVGGGDDPAVKAARSEYDAARTALREAEKAADAADSPEAIRKAADARRAAEKRVKDAEAAMRAAEAAATDGTPAPAKPSGGKPGETTTGERPAGDPPGTNSTYGPGTGTGWNWKPPAGALTKDGRPYEDALPVRSPAGEGIVAFDGDQAVYGDGSQFTGTGWQRGKYTAAQVISLRRERTARRRAAGLPPLPEDVSAPVAAGGANFQGKAAERIVRTPGGARHYGDPVGSPIVPNSPVARRIANAAARGARSPRARREANAADPGDGPRAVSVSLLATPRSNMGKDDVLAAALGGVDGDHLAATSSNVPGGLVSVRVRFAAADQAAADAQVRAIERSVALATSSADPPKVTTGRLTRTQRDALTAAAPEPRTTPDFPTALDVRLVNYKPDRNLADPNKIDRIVNVVPSAEYVPYSQVPFIDALHERMGVDDPATHDIPDYMARRDRLLMAQPIVDVPFDRLVMTQPVVNRDRVKQIIDDPATGGTKPQHFVRHDGKTYVLNGHHRVAAQAAAGDISANGHLLLDLDQQPPRWKVEQNEFGRRMETLDTPVGRYVIDGNGAGRMKWTVEYPDGDYGMTSTRREAMQWATDDLTQRLRLTRP